MTWLPSGWLPGRQDMAWEQIILVCCKDWLRGPAEKTTWEGFVEGGGMGSGGREPRCKTCFSALPLRRDDNIPEQTSIGKLFLSPGSSLMAWNEGVLAKTHFPLRRWLSKA